VPRLFNPKETFFLGSKTSTYPLGKNKKILPPKVVSKEEREILGKPLTYPRGISNYPPGKEFPFCNATILSLLGKK